MIFPSCAIGPLSSGFERETLKKSFSQIKLGHAFFEVPNCFFVRGLIAQCQSWKMAKIGPVTCLQFYLVVALVLIPLKDGYF